MASLSRSTALDPTAAVSAAAPASAAVAFAALALATLAFAAFAFGFMLSALTLGSDKPLAVTTASAGTGSDGGGAIWSTANRGAVTPAGRCSGRYWSQVLAVPVSVKAVAMARSGCSSWVGLAPVLRTGPSVVAVVPVLLLQPLPLRGLLLRLWLLLFPLLLPRFVAYPAA